MKQDEGLLVNIRSNIINGNRNDAYKQIEDYGIANFSHDYLIYLWGLEFDNHIVIVEMRDILRLIKYQFNQSQ